MSSLRSYLSLVVIVVFAGCTDAPAPPDLMNRADPLPGVTTSGQPDEASLQDLAAAGYTTVIDLRRADEDRGFDEQAAVEELGMSYVSLPIDGARGVTYENASLLDAALSDVEGPVLLHCATSNRVGALLSLRERLHGASPDAALALGTRAGLASLREAVEARLDER